MPQKLGQVLVTLTAHEVDAPPSNARATKTAKHGFVVLPPALPAPTMTGPTLVETGKSYTWTAFQRSPFPANSGTDLVIRASGCCRTAPPPPPTRSPTR